MDVFSQWVGFRKVHFDWLDIVGQEFNVTFAQVTSNSLVDLGTNTPMRWNAPMSLDVSVCNVKNQFLREKIIFGSHNRIKRQKSAIK